MLKKERILYFFSVSIILYIYIFINNNFLSFIETENFLIELSNLNIIDKEFINFYIKILFFYVVIFLLFSSYYDFKYKMIYDKYTVPILILGLLSFNYIHIFYTIAILSIIKYIFEFIKGVDSFGEADIIVFSGISAFFDLNSLIIIFTLTTILPIFIYLLLITNKNNRKDKEIKYIPMIPVLTLSIFITIILNNFQKIDIINSFF